jgi:two-component system, chemotaxis family, CheB/CheR fusion protein
MAQKSRNNANLDVEPVGVPPEVSPEEQSNDQNGSDTSFPIVGIGASAGGLEALELFLGHVPDCSGMAFVIVQHLDPTHKCIMPELLQRVTTMKVVQAKERQRVEPNHVYVIPPNKDMSILHGVLHLMEPTAPRGLRLPIDSFLRSLAEDMEDTAVAVILSGMGTDGTLGLRAIKEKAGLVLVQDPASAKFDGMPRSAIDTGLVDIVGPAQELPEKICAYLRHVPLIAMAELDPDHKAHSGLERLITLLRSHTGHDFFQYKKSTLYRRIERRMGIHQISKIDHYVRYLQENPCEMDLLFKELLIGVTSFFRDPEEWARLKDAAIPELLKRSRSSHELRAWVVGCSTGEEAYSLAIVFKEAKEQVDPESSLTLQIFATDLDPDAIDRARQGVYPANITADVSPERLNRFFSKDNGGYRINNEIREMVIFAPQNVIKDPPFTKLDVVTCRNMLIYMEQDLQKMVLRLIHYSLMPDGIMLLGSAESVGEYTDLFKSLEGKSRLYKRLESGMPIEPIGFPRAFVRTPFEQLHQTEEVNAVPNIQLLADHLLLQNYSPAAVLVNNKGDILYISGHTGKYLELAAGKANWNIFAMTREGLRNEMVDAFQRALRQKEKIIIRNLTVAANGSTQTLDLAIQAIEEPEELRGMVMIVFTEVEATSETTVTSGIKQAVKGHSRLAQTQLELQHSREELQGVREEMQASQEELRSANEELQSTNEELQSTNEELTTSREEMQSLNEELQTVNNELQAKLDELSITSDDMKNLLDSTDIATIFLDSTLMLRRFTSEATKMLRLIPGDAGRPITDIASDLFYPELPDDALDVMKTLVSAEKQVSTREGKWFDVRIMPYRTLQSKIDGLVITLMDITSFKTLEAELRRTAERINNILEITSDAYFSLDNALHVTYINPVAEQMLNCNIAAVVGNYLFAVFPQAKGSILEVKCLQSLSEKIPLSFDTDFQVGPFAGWYNVRVYPEADGISVYFQAKTQANESSESSQSTFI